MKHEMESIHFQRQLQKAKKLSLESAEKERRAMLTTPSENDTRRPRNLSKDFELETKSPTPLNIRSPVRRRSLTNSSRQSRSSRRFLMTAAVAANSKSLTPLPSKELPCFVGLQKFVDVVLEGFHSEINVFDRIEVVTPDEFVGAKGLEKEEAEKENTPKKSPSKRNQKPGDELAADSLGKLPQPSFRLLENYVPPSKVVAAAPRPDAYYRYIEKTLEEMEEEVEYEMDCEDLAWLKLYNEHRHRSRHPPVSDETFETLMDRLEKEAYAASQTQRPSSSESVPDEDDVVCAICLDDDCQNTNVILFCDRCNLAVHQECYGVPYVPEGQWLCSPCQAGPLGPVGCVLCPVTGGAMKQTNHGKWSHILCALWIPEVGFGNIESLEPITKIEKVPPGRRRLTCSICRKKDVGACIQCMKKNCFTAFHVTCAQQAGIFMTIEPTHNEDGSLSNVRKTILCDRHKPANARPFQPMYDSSGVDTEEDQSPARPQAGTRRPQKQGSLSAQQLPSQRLDAKPVASVSDDVNLIPKERLVVIMESLKMKDRSSVLGAVQCYWRLKRTERHGLPLLRRLQAASLLQTLGVAGDGNGVSSLTGLRDLKKLRNDMEKVRLLLELIRKREKLKLEEIRLRDKSFRLELEPLNVLLHNTLEQLQAKDRSNIFAFPVPLKELPDYSSKISHPMDFSTMRSKVDRHAYSSIDDFVADFELIISNCMTFNAKHTLYHKVALRLRRQAEDILAEARVQGAGFCCSSGLHLSTVEVRMKHHKERKSISMELTKPASVPALHEDRRSSDRVKMPTRRYLIDDEVVPVVMHSTNRKRKPSTDSEEPPVLSRCPSPVDASSCPSLPAPSRKRSRLNSSHRDPPQLVKSAPCAPSSPRISSGSTLGDSDPLGNSTDWEELIPTVVLTTRKDEIRHSTFDDAVMPLVPIPPSQGSDSEVTNSDSEPPLRSTPVDLLVAVLESDGSNSLPGTSGFPSGVYLESLESLKVDSAYGSASCSSSDLDNCDKH